MSAPITPVTNLNSATSKLAASGSGSQSGFSKKFEHQEWANFQHFIRQHEHPNSISKRSPFVPRNFKEYIDHRVSILGDELQEQKTALHTSKVSHSNVSIVPPYGGKDAFFRIQAQPTLRVSLPWSRARQVQDDTYGRMRAFWENERKNKEWDRSFSFRRKAEFLMGKSLLKEL